MTPTPSTPTKRSYCGGNTSVTATVTPPSTNKARRILQKGWCHERSENGYCCCHKAVFQQNCQACHHVICQGHCISKYSYGWAHTYCDGDEQRESCRSLFDSFVPQMKQLEAPANPWLLENGSTHTAKEHATSKEAQDDTKSQLQISNENESKGFCLTEEQEEILKYKSNPTEIVRIDALAGCGKTTTVAFLCHELAKLDRLGPRSEILYVVFGKSNQIEARQSSKFPKNVEILTSHAFAKRTIFGPGNSIKPINEYPKEEVADALSLKEFVSRKFHALKPKQQTSIRKGIVTIIVKSVLSFQQSSDRKVTDMHIPWNATVGTTKKQWKAKIDKSQYVFWAQQIFNLVDESCCSGENSQHFGGIPHDAYLKHLQLHAHEYSLEKYDVIIVDEAQDLTPCQAALFWGEHFTSLGGRVYLVGDQNQRIYAFRGAKDDFEKAPVAKEFPLQCSFRFGQNIAEVANALLSSSGSDLRLKGCAAEEGSVSVKDEIDRGVVLCRTRNGMIRYLEEHMPKCWTFYSKSMKLPKNTPSVYQEYEKLEAFVTAGMGEADDSSSDETSESSSFGGSFCYMERGTARFCYRDEIFDDKEDLIDFCEEEGDVEMLRKIFLILSFHERNKGRRRSITCLFDELRQTWVQDWRNETSDINHFQGVVLATAHSSKGLEFNHVLIHNDFQFKSMGTQQPEHFISKQFLRETLNLIYVAVTRAKVSLTLCAEADKLIKFLKAQAKKKKESKINLLEIHGPKEEAHIDLTEMHERFESEWQEFENSNDNSVRVDDIPWPGGPTGNEFALDPTMSQEEQKSRLRTNLNRFYKFNSRYLTKVVILSNDDQQRLKEKVDSLCRLSRKYWSLLRDPVD